MSQTKAQLVGGVGFSTADSLTVHNGLAVTGVVTATSFAGNITGNITGNATGLTGTPGIEVGIITASSISAVSADFSGNVTIGGTLQYEDVTNIDAIGIVTARSGINITGAGMTVTGISTFRGDVQVADKIVHLDDSNTAIRFPAADTFTVETAGSERVRVGAAGSVGIGTDDPESALHVTGAIPNAPTKQGVHIGAHSGYGIMQFTAATGGIIDFGESGVDSVGRIIYTHSNDALAFQTGNSEALRIDSGGRMGLGTNSPSSFSSSTNNLVISETGGNSGLTLHTGTSNSSFLGFTDTGDTNNQGYILSLIHI